MMQLLLRNLLRHEILLAQSLSKSFIENNCWEEMLAKNYNIVYKIDNESPFKTFLGIVHSETSN